MTARGRPRKSVADLKLHGEFREDRHAHREEFEAEFTGVPESPDDLNPDEKWLWDLVISEYGDDGPLRHLDSAALYEACVLWGLLRQAQRAAKQDPADAKIGGLVIKYFNAYDKAAAKLGLNPRDRRSIAPEGGRKPSGVKRRERA